MRDPGSRSSGNGDRAVPGLAGLWFGILGPPLIWIARLSASYVLVPLACRVGSVWILNAVTVAALVGVAIAGVVALRAWRLSRATGEADPAAPRARFMAIVGILVSMLFFAVIVAEGIANLLVDPCITGGATL